MWHLRLLSALLAGLLIMPSGASAQDIAQMRILVGSAAGATTDALARLLAEKLRDILRVSVIVENKPGAAQRLALGELKKSSPDGRTVMLASSAAMSIQPHIYGDATGYDPLADFTPVTRLVAVPLAFATGPKTGARDLTEFITWARAHATEVAFASPGAGSASHFAGIMLAKTSGVGMTHVPYRGMAPALTDLTGGHIASMSAPLSDLVALHREGKLRILGMSGATRLAKLPDVPTFREQGHEIVFDVGIDVYAPARVSEGVVNRLNGALIEILNMSDVRTKLDGMNVEPAPMSPGAFAETRLRELRFWEDPVKQSGFKGE